MLKFMWHFIAMDWQCMCELFCLGISREMHGMFELE